MVQLMTFLSLLFILGSFTPGSFGYMLQPTEQEQEFGQAPPCIRWAVDDVSPVLGRTSSGRVVIDHLGKRAFWDRNGPHNMGNADRMRARQAKTAFEI